MMHCFDIEFFTQPRLSDAKHPVAYPIPHSFFSFFFFIPLPPPIPDHFFP